MRRKWNPGCPCCDECPCIIDYGFINAIEDSGTWAYTGALMPTAKTSSSDARLRLPTPIPGWKIGVVRIAPYARDEWYEVGFTDADYDNRIYAKWRFSTSPSQLEIEWRETVGGVDSLISSQTMTVAAAYGVPAINWCIFFHDDLSIVSARLFGAFGRSSVMRAAFTFETTSPYFFIATGTISGEMQATLAGTKRCYSRTQLVDDKFYQTQNAPAEWEIDLSGVAQGAELVTCYNLDGTPKASGYHDFYNEFNNTHVAQFDHFDLEGVNTHNWIGSDSFTWSDSSVLACFGVSTLPVSVTWRVRALYVSKADAENIPSSLVGITPYMDVCGQRYYGCDCQRINPAYDEKPALALVVSVTYGTANQLGFYTCRVMWAAVLASDWDCDVYYGECQQTPILFPARCNFDWRSVQEQELTFLCSEEKFQNYDSGIDWSNSTLRITAIP